MLKWKSDEANKRGENAGHLSLLTIGKRNTWSSDATPADIVQCLKANPEAAGQVLLALESQYIAGETTKYITRAERAEQALATVTAERDGAVSWRDEWHGALQRIQTALAPKLVNKWWTTDEMESEVIRLCDDFRAMQRERDDALAKLAEAERECVELDRQLDATIEGRDRAESSADCLAYAIADESEIGEHSNLNDPYANALMFLSAERERMEALRSRLAKTEAVVAELRQHDALPTDATVIKTYKLEALRSRLAKAEVVVEAARGAIPEMWRLSESSLLRTKMHALAEALRALDEDSGVLAEGERSAVVAADERHRGGHAGGYNVKPDSLPPDSEIGNMHLITESMTTGYMAGATHRRARYAGGGRWEVLPKCYALWKGQKGSVHRWRRADDPVASAKTSDGSVDQQAVTGGALSVASGASTTPNGSARRAAEALRLQATATGSLPETPGITCETCGGPIPEGGEGCPEICPSCMKHEDTIDELRRLLCVNEAVVDAARQCSPKSGAIIEALRELDEAYAKCGEPKPAKQQPEAIAIPLTLAGELGIFKLIHDAGYTLKSGPADPTIDVVPSEKAKAAPTPQSVRVAWKALPPKEQLQCLLSLVEEWGYYGKALHENRKSGDK